MIGWRISLWAVIVLAALVFLYLVRGILAPFLLAFVFSALLDPFVRRLRLRGWPRGPAVATIFSVFLVVIVAAGIWLTPKVTAQVGRLQDAIEQFTTFVSDSKDTGNYFVKWNPNVESPTNGARDTVDRFLEQNRATLERFGLPVTRRAIEDQYIEPHKKDIAKSVQAFFNNFLSLISTIGSKIFLLLFTPLLTVFMLLNMERVKRRSASWIPPSIRAETLALVQDIGEVFIKYLRGVSVMLIWYSIVSGLLLTLLGAPYGILLAVLFSMLSLVPYIGAMINYTVLFLAVGLSNQTSNIFFGTSSSWQFAIYVLILYAAVFIVMDQVVAPRLLGDAVDLDPVVSMFVIFSGGALFGAIGTVIAFPLAGAAKVILDRLIRYSTGSGDALHLPRVPLRHRDAAG